MPLIYIVATMHMFSDVHTAIPILSLFEMFLRLFQYLINFLS